MAPKSGQITAIGCQNSCHFSSKIHHLDIQQSIHQLVRQWLDTLTFPCLRLHIQCIYIYIDIYIYIGIHYIYTYIGVYIYIGIYIYICIIHILNDNLWRLNHHFYCQKPWLSVRYSDPEDPVATLATFGVAWRRVENSPLIKGIFHIIICMFYPCSLINVPVNHLVLVDP